MNNKKVLGDPSPNTFFGRSSLHEGILKNSDFFFLIDVLAPHSNLTAFWSAYHFTYAQPISFIGPVISFPPS